MGVEARYRAVEQRIAAANGLAVRERWVDVASPSVRVRVLESGDGDPVLFIHGVGCPGILMAALAARLAGHRVLLLDLPGHGLSQPYHWEGAPVREQAVNVITAVLDDAAIEVVKLVGNSLGGLFSMSFALERPSRVAQVVLVGNPGSAFGNGHFDLMMLAVTAPAIGVVATSAVRLPLPRFLGRPSLAYGIGANAVRAVSDDIIDLHLLALRLPGQAASFRALLQRLFKGRTPRPEAALTETELASFAVPILFVWGENDRYLSPIAGKPNVDKIPTARLVTIPGGNFPWYDDPDRCAALVAEGF